jgi:hypothetical protein
MSTGPLKDVLAERNFDRSMLVRENKQAMKASGLDLPPLHYAARHGLLSMLGLMVARIRRDDEEDTVLINTPYADRSPLMWAIESRCAHCVELLLGAGADPNFNIDPEMPPPLRYAVEACSNKELIRALTEFGAETLLETRLNSPMQFVRSMLRPCADPMEREHWQWILDLFEEAEEWP